jgi:4-hydroxybenzoyl-CoA thioesterase
MAFTLIQKVMFKHCDPARLVFYPRYFEMINDTIEEFFEQRLNLPFATLHETGYVPTVQIEATFPAPSRLGDVLHITLTCARLGRTSATLSLTATCAKQTRFAATATLVHVNAQGRPQLWPDAVAQKLQAETGEH